MGRISAGAPAKWTGMIKRVRRVSFSRMVSLEIMRVSLSTSAKTGLAPESTIRFTVDTHVMDGVTTSSPGPMPRATRDRCIPAVAEFRATAPPHPTYSLNFSSNMAACLPVVSHPDRSTLPTAEISSSEMEGRDTGRKSFSVNASVLFMVSDTSFFIFMFVVWVLGRSCLQFFFSLQPRSFFSADSMTFGITKKLPTYYRLVIFTYLLDFYSINRC